MPVPVCHSDPEIMSGALVFFGTRVPVQALWDYLEAGHPLDVFLDHYPTVRRDQAVALMESAAEMVRVAHARTA